MTLVETTTSTITANPNPNQAATEVKKLRGPPAATCAGRLRSAGERGMRSEASARYPLETMEASFSVGDWLQGVVRGFRPFVKRFRARTMLLLLHLVSSLAQLPLPAKTISSAHRLAFASPLPCPRLASRFASPRASLTSHPRASLTWHPRASPSPLRCSPPRHSARPCALVAGPSLRAGGPVQHAGLRPRRANR